MNPLAAFDYVTKHRSVADQIVGDLADDELSCFAMDLMRMYSYAARRMLSEIGWLATISMLHEIRENGDDPNQRDAAWLILAYEAWNDTTGVDFGAEDLSQKFHTATLFGRLVAVIAAIPAVWRLLLPQLATPGGQDMLQHFVLEEIE